MSGALIDRLKTENADLRQKVGRLVAEKATLQEAVQSVSSRLEEYYDSMFGCDSIPGDEASSMLRTLNRALDRLDP